MSASDIDFVPTYLLNFNENPTSLSRDSDNVHDINNPLFDVEDSEADTDAAEANTAEADAAEADAAEADAAEAEAAITTTLIAGVANRSRHRTLVLTQYVLYLQQNYRGYN